MNCLQSIQLQPRILTFGGLSADRKTSIPSAALLLSRSCSSKFRLADGLPRNQRACLNLTGKWEDAKVPKIDHK
jgi:hypothetical protein